MTKPLRGLRYIRRTREISQAEMAEKLGMTQPQYCKIEGGQTDPKLSTAVHIAAVLDVRVEELL